MRTRLGVHLPPKGAKGEFRLTGRRTLKIVQEQACIPNLNRMTNIQTKSRFGEIPRSNYKRSLFNIQSFPSLYISESHQGQTVMRSESGQSSAPALKFVEHVGKSNAACFARFL